MRATVIVDNISSEGLPGEWGLCIYIEQDGRKLLLDTGGSALISGASLIPHTLKVRPSESFL